MKSKDFITLDEMMRGFKKINKVYTLIDKLTFFNIFAIWTLIIIMFGLAYFFLSNSFSFISYSATDTEVNYILDSIYFSFITATSTGFGDIIPHGVFKIVSIIEVIFGLLLLAFVTSKLISIKQDAILNEIYEISFNERISRLRSSLLLFRQNLNKIIDRVEAGYARKREISDIYIHLSSFENILNEISSLFGRVGITNYTRVVDTVNTELLFSSTNKSFEKIDELIIILNQANIDWKREIHLDLINRCINLSDFLFKKLNDMKNISEKAITELQSQREKAIDSIKSGLTLPSTEVQKE